MKPLLTFKGWPGQGIEGRDRDYSSKKLLDGIGWELHGMANIT